MTDSNLRLEPRWPAILALLAVGSLRLIVPDSLAVGPKWLLLVVLAALMIPSVVLRARGNHNLPTILGYITSGVVTLDMAWSLGLLVAALPAHTLSPQQLLRSAAALWLVNILVFAFWYWRLDAGGPRAREIRGTHTDGAFLFPQMTLDDEAKRTMGEQGLEPGVCRYLFLAFNTSTAFSPTDAPVLSRWAKGLMMIQSFISFATVALLAARAVNTPVTITAAGASLGGLPWRRRRGPLPGRLCRDGRVIWLRQACSERPSAWQARVRSGAACVRRGCA